jgi:hypothetical protein
MAVNCPVMRFLRMSRKMSRSSRKVSLDPQLEIIDGGSCVEGGGDLRHRGIHCATSSSAASFDIAHATRPVRHSRPIPISVTRVCNRLCDISQDIVTDIGTNWPA